MMIFRKSFTSMVTLAVILFPGLSMAQIQFMGDIMLGDTPSVYSKLLAPIRKILNAIPVNVANLEGVIASNRESKKCSSAVEPCFSFRMAPEAAKHLSETGFTILNLANNHAMDFGQAGASETVNNITGNKIIPIGNSQFPVARIDHNGKQWSLIGTSPHHGSFPTMDMKVLQRMVKEEKANNRLVFITAHIGTEGNHAWKAENKEEFYRGRSRGNPVQFARSLIDAGADGFVGHGPHVLRPIEIYKGRIIAYSLGNFLTYGAFDLRSNMGLGGILEIQVDEIGRFISGKMHGFQQTKSSHPHLWKNGQALIESPLAVSFLKNISHLHQPNLLTWLPDGSFSLSNQGEHHERK